MQKIKVQQVKTAAPTIGTIASGPLPNLIIDIQSIVCLNYPIETLVEVLSAHFDEQSCPANLVVKALKIISISLKDKQLRTQIQTIISQNMIKRHQVFTLFMYWSAIVSNSSQIFSKLDPKIVQNCLGCVIAQYCFTNHPYSKHMSQMITSVINEFSGESCAKISQYVKNQYMSMVSPFQNFISCILKFDHKNQKVYNFFNDIGSSLLKSKQAELALEDILKLYFINISMQNKIDSFFKCFPNLITSFISCLMSNLNNMDILKIWQKLNQFKLNQAIKTSIKQWANKKQNYSKVFTQNFSQNILIDDKQGSSIEALLQLGSQLQDQTLLNKLIIRKMIVSYMNGQNFNKNLFQTKIVPRIIGNKDIFKKVHPYLQTMIEISRNYGGIVNQNQKVRLFITNKINAPMDWPKANLNAIKNCKNKTIMPYFAQMMNMFGQIQKKYQQKSQNIQLAYVGVRIAFKKEDGQNKQHLLTCEQLISALQAGNLPINFLLTQQYPIVEPEQKAGKNEPKRQVQGFVIQAKIVRIMKRSKTDLTFSQIFKEVEKDLGIIEQNFRIALDKVISKGFVSQKPEGKYAYCP